MKPNWPIGPNHEPTPRPSASVSAVISQMAFQGVLNFGCTWPSHPGRAPARPMLKSTRVVAFWTAIDTARAEFTVANSTSSHALPHSRRARSKIWSDAVKLPPTTPFVPKPTRTPQLTRT